MRSSDGSSGWNLEVTGDPLGDAAPFTVFLPGLVLPVVWGFLYGAPRSFAGNLAAGEGCLRPHPAGSPASARPSRGGADDRRRRPARAGRRARPRRHGHPGGLRRACRGARGRGARGPRPHRRSSSGRRSGPPPWRSPSVGAVASVDPDGGCPSPALWGQLGRLAPAFRSPTGGPSTGRSSSSCASWPGTWPPTPTTGSGHRTPGGVGVAPGPPPRPELRHGPGAAPAVVPGARPGRAAVAGRSPGSRSRRPPSARRSPSATRRSSTPAVEWSLAPAARGGARVGPGPSPPPPRRRRRRQPRRACSRSGIASSAPTARVGVVVRASREFGVGYVRIR